MASSQQTGSRSHQGRQHQIVESRNFVCAHVNRRDPQVRRFLQLLSMQSNKVSLLVRDAKTGTILLKPSTKGDAGTWLIRTKAGLGRASKNKWEIQSSVDEKFFEHIDSLRKWHFSFSDYYDICIWDLESGLPFGALHSTVNQASSSAFFSLAFADTAKLR